MLGHQQMHLLQSVLDYVAADAVDVAAIVQDLVEATSVKGINFKRLKLLRRCPQETKTAKGYYSGTLVYHESWIEVQMTSTA